MKVFDECVIYLRKALGVQVKLAAWSGKDDLPLFVRDRYSLHRAVILQKPCILVAPTGKEEITPAAIRKHLELLRASTGVPCVYVGISTPSYNRQRLMSHGVQFVVVGRQIYLPALGIDWLESSRICRQLQAPSAQALTASTQAAMIYVLLHPMQKQYIPSEMAEALSYTPMTMTRVFNELETFELGQVIRKGKERQIHFTRERSALWELAKQFMKSPVKKRFWVKVNSRGMKKIKQLGAFSGLSALAKFSTLSPSEHPVYAVSMQTWNALCRSGDVQEIPSEEGADLELEIWSYDPIVCASEGNVDPFSLYLNLKDLQDERVEGALEKMMVGMQ